MAINGKQLGSILLLTLIFCGACSLLMLLMLETTVLETKMLNHSLDKKQIFLKAIVELKAIEHQLDENPLSVLPKNIVPLQWVPDTLLLSETEGILYYQLTHTFDSPDGASNQFSTTYAIRSSRPKGMETANSQYEEKALKNIPLSMNLPISEIIGNLIVGEHPKDEGVLLYALAKKKYHPGHVVLILSLINKRSATLHKVIDLGKELHPPILRNKILLLNDDEFIMLFDAFTGEYLRKEKLDLISLSLPIAEHSTLTMVVRKPREAKRLILCPTSRGWAKAEIDVDFKVLGRRSWFES